MKLFVLLALCAVATATASQVKVVEFAPETNNALLENPQANEVVDNRNIMMNILVSQMINILRRVIKDGSILFNIPVLDPLVIEHNDFDIPAGIINLFIDIKNGVMTGLGDFVVNRSHLNPSDLTFDIDITIPHLVINAERTYNNKVVRRPGEGSRITFDASGARPSMWRSLGEAYVQQWTSIEEYDFLGDIFTAIPLYGKGLASFELQNWRLYGKFNLKQSDNGKAVIIDSIENPGFELPVIKTKLTGVIGGGDIDNVVNAIIEEVFLGYIDRFSGAIARLSTSVIPAALNPTLGQLNTWAFLRPFV